MPDVKMYGHTAFPGELIWAAQVQWLNESNKTVYGVWCESRECVQKFKLNQKGNPDIFILAHTHDEDEAIKAASNHAEYHKSRGDTISWNPQD